MTYTERAQLLANALVGGVASLALQNRLGRALARRQTREAEYLAATIEDKAKILVESFRQYGIDALYECEEHATAEVARSGARSKIDTDFAELP